jgi:dihydroneopterin aldolase
MTGPLIQRLAPSPAHEEDRVRVFVRDCKVELRVGIYESEQQTPQPVLITVECEAALPHHYHDLAESKLARVIDYEPLYRFMREELPKLGHIYLLETAAEQIVSFCFRDPRVREVSVRIEKSDVFPDAAGAGVEIRRARPEDV